MIKNIKIVLPTLGYDLFSNKKQIKKAKEKIFSLEFEDKEIKEKKMARAILLENGKMIVLKGSQIKKEIQSSLSNGYKGRRERLIQNNVIDSEEYIFNVDCEFSSVSAAAAIILGISVNGRKKWCFGGKSIEEIEKINKE